MQLLRVVRENLVFSLCFVNLHVIWLFFAKLYAFLHYIGTSYGLKVYELLKVPKLVLFLPQYTQGFKMTFLVYQNIKLLNMRGIFLCWHIYKLVVRVLLVQFWLLFWKLWLFSLSWFYFEFLLCFCHFFWLFRDITGKF